MPINMDWVELLRSQQADFIQRLKFGNILYSEIPRQHSLDCEVKVEVVFDTN